ncbi:MAG: hypothetical protein IKR39_04820 [Lachnospiraceae bacterium]|nr:hypothetical protein [Lachnospiraceae bacterium]
MIANLQEYFRTEIGIFLDAVNYKRIEESNTDNNQQIAILCQDNVNASLSDEGVRILITRSVTFDPENIFTMSVSFGADLRFNDRKSEHDWKNINLAEEFMENGDFVTSQLISRISLIIGEITSSFGQQPLILPAVLAKKNMPDKG